MITVTELAKITALSAEEVAKDVEELEEEGVVCSFAMRKDTYVWHMDSVREAGETLKECLGAYEKKYPYRYGMKKAEAQMTHFSKIKPNVFDRVAEMMEKNGWIKRRGEFVCTPDFEMCKDAVYEKVSSRLLGAFQTARFDFVRYSEIDLKGVPRETADDILNALVQEGQAVKVTEDMYTLREYMDEAKQVIMAELSKNPVITIAQVRDLFHTSRKSAKPILEYMDSIKVTKKTGGESERVAYQ